MDIEGAELQVIRGGQRLLGGAEAPPMIFEAHELAPVADALRVLGYRIRQLHYTLEHGLELPDADAQSRASFPHTKRRTTSPPRTRPLSIKFSGAPTAAAHACCGCSAGSEPRAPS